MTWRPNPQDKAAWSAVGGVVTAVGAAGAIGWWLDLANSASADEPLWPVFPFAAVAIVGFYGMLAPLLGWWPWHQAADVSTPQRDVSSHASENKDEVAVTPLEAGLRQGGPRQLRKDVRRLIGLFTATVKRPVFIGLVLLLGAGVGVLGAELDTGNGNPANTRQGPSSHQPAAQGTDAAASITSTTTQAAVSKATAKEPSPAEQGAARGLKHFAYTRGKNGDVTACASDYELPRTVLARINCRNYGNPTTYSLLDSRAATESYFSYLLSSSSPLGGNWASQNGDCQSSWSEWERTDADGEYMNGSISFRHLGVEALLVWDYRQRNVVALADGSIGARPKLCRAWWYNG